MKSMQDRMLAFFSPGVTLRQRGSRLRGDLVAERDLVRQLAREAGIGDTDHFHESRYDDFLAAAGRRDLSVTVLEGSR